MAALSFEDSAGATWEVFEVRRTSQKAGVVSAGLEQGWLAFVNGAEKRRLAPFPPNWSDFPPADLERLCAEARLASPRLPAREPRTVSIAPVGTPVVVPGSRFSGATGQHETERQDPASLSPALDGPGVEEAVRQFAHNARTTGLPAVEAMVRLKGMLARDFADSPVARDPRSVRRWFVDAYYFERDA